MLALLLSWPAPGRAADGSAVTPPLSATVDRVDALRESMVRSADLRLRIVYASRSVLVNQDHDEKGIRTLVRTPVAELYEQARGSTDPLTLELLLAHCPRSREPHDACDRLDIARRWTEADMQNQRAWLWLATVRRESGDEVAAKATFIRAAQASQWHERIWDISRLVADAASRDFTESERIEWLNDAFGTGIAQSLEPYQLLVDYCKRGGALAAACLRIVDISVRDAETLMTVAIAPKLAARAQAPEALVESYVQKEDAMRWALHEDRDPVEAAVDGDPSTPLAHIARQARVSERRRAELALIDRHMGESEAARRHVASLSPEALESRKRWLSQSRAAGAGTTDVNAGSARSTAASP